VELLCTREQFLLDALVAYMNDSGARIHVCYATSSALTTAP